MSKKVKIKLLSSLAGAEVLPAGTVIETTITEAQSLISHGYAELHEEVETKTSKTAESRTKAVKRKTTRKK